MPALLHIESVSKMFGTFRALHEIDLEIQQGEFIALLGPSGCGKTTLLRTLAGFSQPDKGRVLIDGQDVTRFPPYRRPLNTVFQNYALFPHMSVLENVSYGPRRKGLPREDAKALAFDALRLVGLEGLADRYSPQLSGGQQQRVALARAIVNKPKLLLLDEPLSALDLKLRKRMQLELKHLQEKLGIAFIFVTHDQEEAMTMADRIVVMNAGQIEQIGRSTDIYDRPSTYFVADFIGEANMIPCSVEQDGTIRFPFCEGVWTVSSGSTGNCLGVARPEQLSLRGPQTPLVNDEVALEGVISDIVNMGSHQSIYIDTVGIRLVVRRIGTANENIKSGARATVALRPSDLHLVKAP